MRSSRRTGIMKLMARFIVNLGKLLMISRRQRRVRKSLVLLYTNILVLIGIIFGLEIVLIFLGVENITLPIPFLTSDLVTKLLF